MRTSHRNDSDGCNSNIRPVNDALMRGIALAIITHPIHWLKRPRQSRAKPLETEGIANDVSVASIAGARLRELISDMNISGANRKCVFGVDWIFLSRMR